jgi:2-isopropylmalate synthase
MTTENKWDVPDKWHVSPYNYAEEVRAGYENLPERVTIRDVTLAEGQHQPGVHYTLEGMLEIARALHEAGITMIKQHIGDFQPLEFIRRVKRQIPDVFIHVTIPIFENDRYRESNTAAKQDMDVFIDAGIDEVDFPGFNSWSCPEYIEEAISKEARLEKYAEMTQYARSNGVLVEAAHVDTTRTPWEDLKEHFDNAVKAGATSIALYDSYGVATPDAMKYLVMKVKKEYGLPVLVHAHNDLGSAEATEIGGIIGGASLCDVSVNGLGDRAGNASLEQVVMQLELNYGFKTGVKLERLLGLCRLVEKVTGIEFPFIKPVSGKNVFTHESEAHAAMILNQGLDLKYASKHEAYSPQVVGGTRMVRFGGTSLTGTMIRLRMEQLGLKFDDKEVKEVSSRIRRIFETRGTDISLPEFDTIAKEVCK